MSVAIALTTAVVAATIALANGSSNSASAVSAAGGASLCYGQIVAPQYLADTVTLIDQQTNLITRTIGTPDEPMVSEFSGDGRFLFIPSMGTNTITMIDTSTNAVVRTISLQRSPQVMVANRAGTMLWSQTWGGGPDQILRIDTTTGAVLATFSALSVTDLFLSPDESTLWAVVNSGLGPVDLVELNATTLAQISLTPSITSTYSADMNRAGTKIYFADSGGSGVIVFDTATHALSTLGTLTQLFMVTVAPSGNMLYGIAGGYLTGRVVAIDTTTGQSTLGVPLTTFFSGGTAVGITVTADGSKVIISYSDYALGGLLSVPTTDITTGVKIPSEIYSQATVCPLAVDPDPATTSTTTSTADPVVPAFTG